MAKIRQSNLDNSIVTGLGELTSIASDDQTIIYDASSGTLKKISQTNFLNSPLVSSVSPTSVTSGDGTGNYTFTITGTGFLGGLADLVNSSGVSIAFDTVTIDSATQITGVIAKSSLPGSGEPYDVRVTGSNGIKSTLENQINIDQSPTFNTTSGSLGTVNDGDRGTTTLTVEAFDPESAGNVTFEIQSGSLPSGATTSTLNENGVSKFQISSFSSVGSSTTSNFVVRAADANSNTSSRAFSITINPPPVQTFTSSGTFSVPSGVTAVDVLVVGGGAGGGDQHGGGGGAGGLIFMPNYPVTPGGTVSVTVGCGGAGSPAPAQRGCSGQDSVFGTLTAKGGGGGGGFCGNGPGLGGGSGGGGGSHSGTKPGGSATQPTQPGNSGAYGFGNPGGTGGQGSGQQAGGGGGGAGAAGSINSPTPNGGDGGVGKAYTIADGTTPVYYAGGGGGGSHQNPTPPGVGGAGGQGGGGHGGKTPSCGTNRCEGDAGQANKGGGGGGSGNGGSGGGAGGKGVVIVRWTI